jgi:hypothetical protein
MTDTEDDKYHKLLELVESLNFNEGTYVKICDSLKSIKNQNLQDGEVYKVEKMNVKFDFKVNDIFYTYVYHEKQYVRGSNPDKLKYSVNKRYKYDSVESTFKDYIEPYHIVNYKLLFRRLIHSRNICITYFDEDGNTDFLLKFENLPDLERYYHKQAKENCKYCCFDSEESQDECDNDHENFCYQYYFSKMLCYDN